MTKWFTSDGGSWVLLLGPRARIQVFGVSRLNYATTSAGNSPASLYHYLGCGIMKTFKWCHCHMSLCPTGPAISSSQDRCPLGCPGTSLSSPNPALPQLQSHLPIVHSSYYCAPTPIHSLKVSCIPSCERVPYALDPSSYPEVGGVFLLFPFSSCFAYG